MTIEHARQMKESAVWMEDGQCLPWAIDASLQDHIITPEYYKRYGNISRLTRGLPFLGRGSLDRAIAQLYEVDEDKSSAELAGLNFTVLPEEIEDDRILFDELLQGAQRGEVALLLAMNECRHVYGALLPNEGDDEDPWVLIHEDGWSEPRNNQDVWNWLTFWHEDENHKQVSIIIMPPESDIKESKWVQKSLG